MLVVVIVVGLIYAVAVEGLGVRAQPLAIAVDE